MRRDVTKTDWQRRKRMSSPNKDQRVFSRTADLTHRSNVSDRPKRGGIRL